MLKHVYALGCENANTLKKKESSKKRNEGENNNVAAVFGVEEKKRDFLALFFR